MHAFDVIATGNFNNNYNFTTGSGAFSLTNFDVTHSLTGTVNATGNGMYTGNVNGGTDFGVVNGRFFGPSNTTAAPPETGGNFAFGSSSTAYTAAGVFLGHH